jgi:hypothetical protein
VDYGKTGASLRRLVTECRDHEQTSRSDRPSQYSPVVVSRFLVDEEVEDRAVVPEIPGPVWFELRDVRVEPADRRSASAQPIAGPVQRNVGEVEHRQVVVSEIEEVVDQPTVSPTDIDQRVGR